MQNLANSNTTEQIKKEAAFFKAASFQKKNYYLE